MTASPIRRRDGRRNGLQAHGRDSDAAGAAAAGHLVVACSESRRTGSPRLVSVREPYYKLVGNLKVCD
jgi:hypothetical protein